MKRVAAIALLLIVACAPDEVAEVPEGPWSGATVVEELAIGIEFGDDDYMISNPSDVAVAADGTIYVADRSPIKVRAYRPDGTFIRQIGREGQGPGEYAGAPILAVMDDGRLATWDYRASRVSFFSPEGEFLDSFHANSGLGGEESLVIGTGGEIFVRTFNREVVGELGYLFLLMTGDGEEVGRIALPAPERVGGAGFVLGFGTEGGIAPFYLETPAALSPYGYTVSGRNDVYDILLDKQEGPVHLRRDVERAQLSGGEKEQWEAFRQSLVERAAAQGRDTVYEPIPETKPFFRSIYVGDDGRIWVFRYVEAIERDDIEPLPDRPDRPLLTWREPWTFDVFEPEGEYLGEVVLPEAIQPYVLRGDQVWGALTGDDGVERIVRLRVVPAG